MRPTLRFRRAGSELPLAAHVRRYGFVEVELWARQLEGDGNGEAFREDQAAIGMSHAFLAAAEKELTALLTVRHRLLQKGVVRADRQIE